MRRKKTLDELDTKIIKTLLENGRLSSRQIAEKLDVSVGTVINRIQKLEKEGIITGYTALLDHERLGYELIAVIDIKVSQGKLLEVENEIAKLPNTCLVYDVTGDYDAVVVAKFRNRKELSNFVKTLLSLNYVERTNTHIVLNTVKEDFRLL
jgi:DNA-binding Lrp family transcriptional regulator